MNNDYMSPAAVVYQYTISGGEKIVTVSEG
jgi:hypothetical protein